MKAINKWFRTSLKGDTDDIQVDKRSSKQDFQKRSSSCSQQDVLVRTSSIKHDDKKRRSKQDNRKRSYSQGEDHEKHMRISSEKDEDKMKTEQMRTSPSQHAGQIEISQFHNEHKMDKSQSHQNGQIISSTSQHEDKMITMSYQNDDQVITSSPRLKQRGTPIPKSNESVGTLPSENKVHQIMSMSQHDDQSPQQKDGNIPASEGRNEGQPSQLEDEISALLSQFDAEISNFYINDDQISSSSSQSDDKISTSKALVDTKLNPPPFLQNNNTISPSQYDFQYDSQVRVPGDQLQEDFLAFENVNEETHLYEKVNSNLDKNISQHNDEISMNQEIPSKSPILTSSKVSSNQEKLSNSTVNSKSDNHDKLNNDQTSKSEGSNVSRKTSLIPKMIPTKSAIPRLVTTESSSIPKLAETTLIPRMITSQQVAKSLPKKSRIPSHIQKKSTHLPPTIPQSSAMNITQNSSVLQTESISEKKDTTETKSEACLTTSQNAISSEKKEMTTTDTKSSKTIDNADAPQKQNKTSNLNITAINNSENTNALQKDQISEKKDTTETKSKTCLPSNTDEHSNSAENTSMTTTETKTTHTLTKSQQLQKQNQTSIPTLSSRSMTAPETSLKTYSSTNNISSQPSSIPKMTRRMTLTGSFSPQRKSASTKDKKTEGPSRKMPPRSKTFQLMTFKSRKSASSGTPPEERTPKASSASSTLPRPKTANTIASTSSKLPTAPQIIPNSEQHFNKVLHQNWHPFLKFLKQEYSEENFYFWSACEKYNSTIDPQERLRIAQAIVKRHLIEDAIQHVNIDAVQSRTIQETVAAANNGDPIDEKLLIKAQKRVYNLMKSDSFTRYLKSDLYNNAEEHSKNKVESKESIQKRKTKLPFSNKKKRTSPLNRLSLSFN